jgi:phytoene synthase
MPQAVLSYCAEHVRRFDNDRFVCSLFAPADVREALAAVFAFNVEVARIPELAREPLLAEMRMQWWREAIDAVFAGSPSDHALLRPLAFAVRRCGLSRRHFDRIIQGRERDLVGGAPPSLESLVDYAEATSSALSALALEVLECDGEAEQQAARDAGIAWALVGLLRAVPFHARARRVYLPSDLNRLAGLDVFRLFDKGLTDGVQQVVSQVADQAAVHLRAARQRRSNVTRRALPVLLTATLADGYLCRLRKAAFNPFDRRAQTRAPSQLVQVAVNGALGRF